MRLRRFTIWWGRGWSAMRLPSPGITMMRKMRFRRRWSAWPNIPRPWSGRKTLGPIFSASCGTKPCGSPKNARERAALPVTEVGSEDPPPLEEYEIKRSVRLAVEKLPPNQSEVVVLKIWEGMTFLEIAEVLGESPNTVASRYRYGLEKLTRLLQGLSSEVSRDV